MNTRFVAFALIMIGVIVMVWGTIGFRMRETIVDIGPIHATRDSEHTLPYAPVLGGVILVAGVALLLTRGRVGG